MYILKDIGKDFFTDPSLVIMIMVTNMWMRMIGMVMVMMEMQCVHEAD